MSKSPARRPVNNGSSIRDGDDLQSHVPSKRQSSKERPQGYSRPSENPPRSGEKPRPKKKGFSTRQPSPDNDIPGMMSGECFAAHLQLKRQQLNRSIQNSQPSGVVSANHPLRTFDEPNRPNHLHAGFKRWLQSKGVAEHKSCQVPKSSSNTVQENHPYVDSERSTEGLPSFQRVSPRLRLAKDHTTSLLTEAKLEDQMDRLLQESWSEKYLAPLPSKAPQVDQPAPENAHSHSRDPRQTISSSLSSQTKWSSDAKPPIPTNPLRVDPSYNRESWFSAGSTSLSSMYNKESRFIETALLPDGSPDPAFSPIAEATIEFSLGSGSTITDCLSPRTKEEKDSYGGAPVSDLFVAQNYANVKACRGACNEWSLSKAAHDWVGEMRLIDLSGFTDFTEGSFQRVMSMVGGRKPNSGLSQEERILGGDYEDVAIEVEFIDDSHFDYEPPTSADNEFSLWSGEYEADDDYPRERQYDADPREHRDDPPARNDDRYFRPASDANDGGRVHGVDPPAMHAYAFCTDDPPRMTKYSQFCYGDDDCRLEYADDDASTQNDDRSFASFLR
jgi:hypothetical protein